MLLRISAALAWRVSSGRSAMARAKSCGLMGWVGDEEDIFVLFDLVMRGDFVILLRIGTV